MRGRPTPLASLLGGAAYGGPYRHLPEWPSRAPQVTRAWSSPQPHFKTFFCDYLTDAPAFGFYFQGCLGCPPAPYFYPTKSTPASSPAWRVPFTICAALQ